MSESFSVQSQFDIYTGWCASLRQTSGKTPSPTPSFAQFPGVICVYDASLFSCPIWHVPKTCTQVTLCILNRFYLWISMYKCLCLFQQLVDSERGHGFEGEQGVVKGSQGGKERMKCSNFNIIFKVFFKSVYS